MSSTVVSQKHSTLLEGARKASGEYVSVKREDLVLVLESLKTESSAKNEKVSG